MKAAESEALMRERNAESIAITGGYVVPVSGPPIPKRTVLLARGRIDAAGPR